MSGKDSRKPSGGFQIHRGSIEPLAISAVKTGLSVSWTGSEAQRKSQRAIEAARNKASAPRYRDPIRKNNGSDGCEPAERRHWMRIARGTPCLIMRIGNRNADWKFFRTTKYLRFSGYYSVEGTTATFKQRSWLIRVERGLMTGNPESVKDRALQRCK